MSPSVPRTQSLCYQLAQRMCELLPDTAPARNRWRLLHEHGRLFAWEPHDAPARVEAKRQCFRNAALAAFNQGLAYVEGYAVPHDVALALEHAWCLCEDGSVYDPTWPDGAQEYFGVAVPTPVLRRALAEKGTWGFLDWQGLIRGEWWPS